MDVQISRIRVFVVDDHALLREGIADAISAQADMQFVGEACNGAEAVSRFSECRPDVTLMDLQMPEMDGVSAIRAIREKFRHARFLVLTTYKGDARAVAALEAGASGYLLKSRLRKELLDAIRGVHAGRRLIDPDVAAEIAQHAGNDKLSDREIGVLRCVAAGNSNKQVADRLSISEETVKQHMKKIMAKLYARDRTDAVAIALRRGIIEI